MNLKYRVKKAEQKQQGVDDFKIVVTDFDDADLTEEKTAKMKAEARKLGVRLIIVSDKIKPAS